MEPVSTPSTDTAKAEPELDQDVGKKQTGKGKRGSLENPEVYENVPGHVIPILEREFDDFDTEAAGFLRGEQTEEQFIGFRLKQGVYGQRQPDVQMVRVKLPFGGVTPEQMEMFAEVVERYAPLNKGHITTRQNIQIHHVPLADMTEVIRLISDTGLSSREGCGNTVRNVTGDPWAGVCEGEPFDITPYAGAYVRYFVRHPTTQLMPRKVKTAFTATEEDRAITGIHDVGFIPKVREIEGRGEVRGVEIRVGGGTSIMPRVAPTLSEFVELDNGDYLKWTEAALRIFDRQQWLRVNRARARIKVLVDKIGMDAFREMVEQELEGDWVAERDFSIDHMLFVDDEEAGAPAIPDGYGSPNGDASEFERFKQANVAPQRQQGFSTIEVKVTRGDLSPEQFRGLASIMRDFSGGYARSTVQQNMVLRWVRSESLYDAWQRLVELGLGDAGADEITDVVSCPGTDSCKLGITSSMGLNRVVQERIEEMQISDPLTKRVHIKMSGCPNGCSQHHIANIGFYGASIKVGDHTIPAYIAHLGGNYEGGEVVYGHRLKARLPAKRVPDAVERWLRHYEDNRNEGEEFNAFVERVGTEPFEELISELRLPVEFNAENLMHFIDWSRTETYKVERGEGECAV
ncbi:MAG: nitrite/sulfite reductase [Solirubrobacterales bacterium]|nr:nitrite/sulfite reductase [Solirubrobacterales bacterium]